MNLKRIKTPSKPLTRQPAAQFTPTVILSRWMSETILASFIYIFGKEGIVKDRYTLRLPRPIRVNDHLDIDALSVDAALFKENKHFQIALQVGTNINILYHVRYVDQWNRIYTLADSTIRIILNEIEKQLLDDLSHEPQKRLLINILNDK